ncbi:bifunctional glycosyltransferase/CDP-glycerol:glycerophosphate glycerophosphotransferase [Catellatospora citrea]|uniref:Glycosyl transferase n=1 Tax=Catellatospora citrea TaxID=53366 RepID=A0A8J3P0K9_9ACTN|nr:bifunctional glycosyltransferase family 2 protein/CDP-glycerol:glycerophosphate glycerophosphotransferase [Catellatospora citrea]RKE09252.1 CDP-glycerol:poly(glycerophosphate) glycerophosphotransferase [Catellatospora citrea]GIF99568.1 glycosyl transferase [Catellatospora citrea]
MTLLSIVLPAYRVQGYLRECLDSILDQGFGDVELIAVDDRSPDHCGEILDEYAARDARVRVLHLAQNVGLGEARNVGLAQATGEYVWFVDTDDTLTPGSLETVARALHQQAPDVLIVDFKRTYPIGRPRRSRLRRSFAAAVGPNGADLQARPNLIKTIHTVWNKIVRRDLLAKLDLRFAPGWYEDVSWTYPLLVGAERIFTLEEVCYAYRQRRQGAITRTVNPRHLEVFSHWERAWELIDRQGGRADPIRPVLFARMIWHLMQTVGNTERLPPNLRRHSFLRTADMFARYLPAGGFAPPRGADGLRYRLVARRAWRSYAALQAVRRAQRSLRGALDSGLRERAGSGSRPGLLARAYYRLQRSLPLDENLAGYAAYWYREVSCNPAAVEQAARRLAPHVRGMWMIGRDAAGTVPAGTVHVVEGTRAYYRLLARAKYLVNNVNFPDFVRKRPGQVHLQTHHGTPVKAMGLDEQRFPAGERHNFAALLRRSDRWDFSVSANAHSTEVWERAYPCAFESLETGSPRNDRLARAGAAESAAARAALGVPEDETVVLYMPTSRPEPLTLPPFDPAALAAALGPRGRVLVRGRLVPGADSPDPHVQDVSGYPVVEDLYLASDILVSDYSSVIFDFAVLDRPIVLYVPDWAQYRAARGASLDVLEHAPGPVAGTFAELVSLLAEDRANASSERRAAFRDRFCAWEDGHAAERVVRRVFLGEQVTPPRPVPPR